MPKPTQKDLRFFTSVAAKTPSVKPFSDDSPQARKVRIDRATGAGWSSFSFFCTQKKQHSLESARERTKELAPWVSDDQIERNASGKPTGVSGNHTPFPPFHWKCRTGTEVVI